MLQGGPLPNFMHEDLITKLFVSPDGSLSPAEKQLQDGLAKFGVVEV